MVMKLNTTPEVYKEFYGRNTEQMPTLIAEGRVPMNVSQLMQRRLDYRNRPAEVKTAWMDNYFDTGDAVVYHPKGDVKIVLDSQTLREMTSESQRNNGALVLVKMFTKHYPAKYSREASLERVGIGCQKQRLKLILFGGF
jgi:hypothetical protein